MRVLNYQAKNVLRLNEIDFNLEGRSLFLVGGKNGEGKSSALNALLMALCGRSGMDEFPEVALKQGQDEGFVRVALEGGLSAELKFRRKRGGQVVEEFRVFDADGKEQSEPRALLKRLCELRGFDPLAFDRLDKKGRRELLARLVGVDLASKKAEYKAKYDERARVGAEGKKLRAQLDASPEHKDVPADEVSTAELMAELERRRAHNEKNAAERKRADDLSAKQRENVERQEVVRQSISEIEAKLAEFRQRLAGLEMDGDSLKRQCEEADACVMSLQDDSLDEVRQKIASSGDVNAKVRANKQRRELQASVEAKRREYEALDKALEANLAEQQKALQEAPWPVPGLSLDDDGVLLDGLPIEQASRAKRITTSVKIGMALNPKLRLLVCQDGSDLDMDTLAALDKILAENDFQMLVELVTRTDADEKLCAVVIRDGAAVVEDK